MNLFPAQKLIGISTCIFEAAGTPPDIARVVAESLVMTNLLGHDSHGVIRVWEYIVKIREGYLKPAERPEILSRTGATAVIDCGWGFGQVGARYAAQIVGDVAAEFGIGCVSLNQVNHIGRLGEYAGMLAERGFVALVIASGSMSWGKVAPYGGKQNIFGTNPIAWAIPVPPGHFPVIADFATAGLSVGKLMVAASKGEPIPLGILLDKDGNPSTDPTDLDRGGILLPFGSYKGYGLTLMIEIIASALSNFAPSSSKEFKRGNPTMMIAVSVEAFTERARFERLVAELLHNVKKVKAADGFDEVLLPGEPEARSYIERSQTGIPLPDATWQQIKALADEIGVSTA